MLKELLLLMLMLMLVLRRLLPCTTILLLQVSRLVLSMFTIVTAATAGTE